MLPSTIASDGHPTESRWIEPQVDVCDAVGQRQIDEKMLVSAKLDWAVAHRGLGSGRRRRHDKDADAPIIQRRVIRLGNRRRRHANVAPRP